MYWPNLKFVALPVPEIIAIGQRMGRKEGEGGHAQIFTWIDASALSYVSQSDY